MRLHLSLALYGDHLSLFMGEIESREGWGGSLRALLRRDATQRQANVAAGGARGVPTQFSTELTPGTLGAALEQAWTAVAARHPQAGKNTDFSVQLGLAHARLGLVPLVKEGSTHPSKEAVDSYLRAWVEQMWSLDPATQIIRWEATEAGDQVLISCIESGVYEELESFSHRHGLRFVSCTPAVLSAARPGPPQPRSGPSAATQSAESAVTVWSEPSSAGQRIPLVQLIHHLGAQPQALWRGWLPPTHESRDAPDVAIQGALRRFLAANKLPMSTAVKWRHWKHQPLAGPASGVQA